MWRKVVGGLAGERRGRYRAGALGVGVALVIEVSFVPGLRYSPSFLDEGNSSLYAYCSI